MRLDAPGTIGTLGNTEGGGLACPTLQNGMLFRFLGHFSLISHYFSRFYAFFTRLDAPGGSRGTREHRRGCRPSKMVCYFDFSAILAYFSLFFAILGIFHVFGCTWKAYYGNKRAQGGGLACPTLQNGMLCRFFGHFSLNFRSFL